MTRDRRGFDYALEPMRSVTEWDVNDTARELAEKNSATDTQQNKVDHLSNSFAAARAEVIQQRQVQALLNIDSQRVAHAYMMQVRQNLRKEKGQLLDMEQERDDTMMRLN